MSALELIDATLAQMSHELNGWRVWAAKRVCDCEALSLLNDAALADPDRHRVGCRYYVLATDLADE